MSDEVSADSGLSEQIPSDIRDKINAAANAVSKQLPGVSNVTEQIIWNSIRHDIETILDNPEAVNPGKDGYPGTAGGGGPIGPMFVRLAWHCAGTWDNDAKNGGSEGATMRFAAESSHGGNAGLWHARELLEPLYAKYKGFGITYADLYIFSGCVSIEAMAGPDCPFRTGRSDAKQAGKPGPGTVDSPDGRLPDADGAGKYPGDHLRDIFYRMGFNDREIVALSGAHCLGHVHTDRSGFWGPWTNAPTTFANEYFRLLLEEKWSIKFEHNGKNWDGPEQYESVDGKLMMLPTDMALVQDPRFKKHVVEYRNDEALFFRDFAAAWTTLTENGCNNLSDKPVINLSRATENNAVVQEAIDLAVAVVSKAIGETKSSSSWWPF
jgi:cytochrome c peroxidase